MSFNMRLKFWNRPTRPGVAPTARPRPAAFRPQVEQLEDRIVPAVTFTQSGTLLTVTCGGTANDNVLFAISGANVLVNGAPTGATVGFLGNLGSVVVNGNTGTNIINASALPVPCILNGGDGNDTLIGGSAADLLNGGNGNDVLEGNGGDDDLRGDAGIDTVREDNTEFVLTNVSLTAGFFSGLGTDALTSVEKADLTGDNNIFGNNLDARAFTGSVTLRGLGGNDLLQGGSGADFLDGGSGDDQLFGNGGADIMTGGAGNDTIDGGTGVDTLKELRSSSTNKVITLNPSSFTVSDAGTVESDSLINMNTAQITVSSGSNTIDAATFTGPVTLNGGSGRDSLIGGSAADAINGNGGDDVIQGGAGADRLNGGDNDDSLFGFTILDFTDGAADTMNGNNGNDFGSGNDTGDVFNQGAGTGGLAVLGTDGDDIIVISRVVGPDGPEAVLNINGVESSVLYTNGQTVRVFAGKGNDIVVMDESTAVTWSAQLFGEAGKDLLVGASRGDYLDGGDGEDTLMGLAGDDTLVGGAGRDELHGGAGADIVQAIDGSIDWIFADIYDLVAKDKKDHLIWV